MLTFTEQARDTVLSFIQEGEGDLQALRITLRNGSPLAPAFELSLVGVEEAGPEDLTLDAEGFKVIVEKESVDRLEGATVDFVERLNESGFEIRPAEGKSLHKVEAPSGELADKVQAVLEQQVNPAIAAHGGRIDLVEVKGTELYMEMSGGCQGCAMSRLTLQQGVEKMIRQSVPEVTEIHDVTDHTAGDNPYFTG